MLDSTRPAPSWPDFKTLLAAPEPRGSLDRAAWLIVRGCSAESDLSTLRLWAQFVAMSVTQLCNVYYSVDVRPRDARDFMRIMRALGDTGGRFGEVSARLDCRDYRTLNGLRKRAGLPCTTRVSAASPVISVEAFIAGQTFLRPGHLVVGQLMSQIRAGATGAGQFRTPGS